MAKKPKKNRAALKLHVFYDKKGDVVERKNRFCPKCGPGVFLARHADRSHCGHCGYTEFVKEK